MSRESVKQLIDCVEEKEQNIIYKILLAFIPEDVPCEDELETLEESERDKEVFGINEIDWS